MRKSGQKTLSCKLCGQDGHNKSACPSKKKRVTEGVGTTIHTDNVPSQVTEGVGTTIQTDNVPSRYSIPVENGGVSDIIVNQSEVMLSTDCITNDDTAQVKKPKRKIRCSVCLKEGHRRNKCDAPAAQIWRNMDFYAPNHQYVPQEKEMYIPPKEHVSETLFGLHFYIFYSTKYD